MEHINLLGFLAPICLYIRKRISIMNVLLFILIVYIECCEKLYWCMFCILWQINFINPSQPLMMKYSYKVLPLAHTIEYIMFIFWCVCIYVKKTPAKNMAHKSRYTCFAHTVFMSPESYEKIWIENFLLSAIHSLVLSSTHIELVQGWS